MTEQTAALFIDCRNALAEGPLWHPGRSELFWFDIPAGRLYCANTAGEILSTHEFGEPAAAAAIIDDDTLLVATASELVKLTVESGTTVKVAPLEADKPENRSNDSRVDFSGGFWIGTMGRQNPGKTGAVYQYKAGNFTTILSGISIPNATCFAPDGKRAYWADTPTGKIVTCTLDPETGLPNGPWEEFVDTADQRGSPDGAVVDSEGFVWSARWGGGCVVRHAPDGSIERIVEVPASNITCPCFGGDDLKTLYITSAREGLSDAQRAAEPHAGSIFSIRVDVPGLPENKVLL